MLSALNAAIAVNLADVTLTAPFDRNASRMASIIYDDPARVVASHDEASPGEASRNEASLDEASRNEASPDEASHDEKAHLEAAHDEAAHDEAVHDEANGAKASLVAVCRVVASRDETNHKVKVIVDLTQVAEDLTANGVSEEFVVAVVVAFQGLPQLVLSVSEYRKAAECCARQAPKFQRTINRLFIY